MIERDIKRFALERGADLVGIASVGRLEPDPLVEEELCVEGCSLCVDACPAKAIVPGRVTQKLCREYSWKTLPRGQKIYGCWECRKVCPR